ncbi:conserved hypothetical protein [Aeropyrum pernix]|uniref:SAM-dependent chlorinase/fluorinase n=1 Tax=Aeropyrum pernix TaxID=56636 RepID=A0A401H7H2_AERPX|nr:S-adenosyl-l-methionine hydroxide adenosyltransferase family protein [Aeropyrum pernix]GBF08353.1 conserved hypothetical protein [Aeropyrum pernix]
MVEPSKVVGLISDFGDSPYTGIMRAVIKSISRELQIIDIDHSIPSFSPLAGAYVVAHTYQWLPKGSVIVAVVDPGVGTSRYALAVETENYVFIGPDNGVLYPAAASDGIKRVYALREKDVNSLARMKTSSTAGTVKPWSISRTFHGRDVFAPAGALIAAGHASLEELGDEIEPERMKRTSIDHVEKLGPSTFRATVVYIDKFGNVALSIRPKKLGINLSLYKSVVLRTHTTSNTIKMGKTFGDANPGELVAYENSFGHLEIAVNRGNAAKKLGLELEARVEIELLENSGPVPNGSRGMRNADLLGVSSRSLGETIW